MNRKSIISMALAATMIVGCSSASGTSATGSDSKGRVYYLNFKPEADEYWQDLAKEYTEETGVPVTVLTAASGEYEKTLKSEMAKSEAPTLFQVNGPVGLASWKDYCADLSGTDVDNELTNKAYELKDGDKVAGIGYVTEAYGLITNNALLKKAGYDASEITSFDKLKKVAEDITAEAVKTAGYDSLDAAKKDGTAFVFMGHGTSHSAKISYSQMSTQMDKLGYDNVFIGTVEGEPEETSCENVIKAVKDAGYKKVILRPLMVVAGDHANNDMAGDDDDSWKSQFTASGNFDSVDTQIAGLGEIEAVQKLYVEHTKKAIESLGKVSRSASSSAASALEDGTYTAKFNTDSGMFHVNEADNGCGTLTVKDKKMTIHIRLVSKKIVNLFLVSAKDAEKDGAELLQPTTDKVKYSDGTTEEVYGFDVPVPALDEEFDLALIGTKGKWYDHKVSVSNPVKAE